MVRAQGRKADIMDRAITLQKVLAKQMTQREAGEELGMSDRHIRRLLKGYRQRGWRSLIFQHRGGNHGFREDFKAHVLSLVRSQYADFGPTFASEKLKEVHGLEVSRETLRQWMARAGLWRKKGRQKAQIHQSRSRRPRFGELVQLDGSPHDWFEGRGPECCLLVLIDDATSKLIVLRFEEAETTLGYMRCIDTHVKRYGRPLAYYSDKHSIFKTTREQCVDRRLEDTQLHRALKELNIELICAHSPQAKGRVERANGILQDRLIKEMRLRGISTIEEGNAYLEEFRQAYNQKFGVEPANPEDAHRPLPVDAQQLELILSKREKRKLSKNLEFSFENKIYQIQGVGKGYRLQQAQVTVCETAYGKTIVTHEGKPLNYSVLEKLKGPKVADCKEINNLMDQLIKRSGPTAFPTGSTAPAQLGYKSRWESCGLVDNAKHRF